MFTICIYFLFAKKKKNSEEKALGQRRIFWSVKQMKITEKEKVPTWRIWEIHENEQQHQEVHEKGRRKLKWDWRKSGGEQQQEGPPTREILDHCETRECYYYPRPFRKMPYRRTRHIEPMDRILLWTVQSQGQGRFISGELSPDRHGSGFCSINIEEREVSWSWQHPSRTGPSRSRRSNHCSHDNLKQDLADRRMANPLDPGLGHHTHFLKEATYIKKQPAAVPELQSSQPHQPPKQKSRLRLCCTD